MLDILSVQILFESCVNGEQASIFYSGSHAHSAIEEWQKIYFLEKPLIQKEIILILEGGQEVVISVSGSPFIMPSGKEVLIISDWPISKKKYKIEYYERPHNAAIYNSDGTFHHQLIVPNELLTLGGEGWYIHSTCYADFPSIQGFGVMVTNDHKWPELCFCLYDGTPNLVWTGYQQERR